MIREDIHGPRCVGDGRYARHWRGDRKGAQGSRLQGRGQLRRQRRGGAEIQGRDRHRRLQVGRLVLRRLRRRHQAGRGRTRSDRRAGQQCRHHPRRHAASHEARAMDRGDQHQSRLAVQHEPQRHRRHARAQVRPHRQHLLDQRPEGPARPDQLFRRQGRRDRLHQGAGAGERASRHHRQRHLSGLHRHRDGAGGAEGRAGKEHPAAHSDRPARRAGGDRALRGVPGLRRCRLDHRRDADGQRRAIFRTESHISAARQFRAAEQHGILTSDADRTASRSNVSHARSDRDRACAASRRNADFRRRGNAFGGRSGRPGPDHSIFGQGRHYAS